MSTNELDELALRQLSERLENLRLAVPLRSPPPGWLRTIRAALGIRTAQLAARLGMAQPSVVRAEERERSGAISLGTLRRMADELDCDLVYYLLPRRPLLQHVADQAQKLARAEAEAVSHSLALEWQTEPPAVLLERVDQLRDRLVADRPAALWDPAPQ